MRIAALLLLAVALPVALRVAAADPAPEITRAAGSPQPIGAVHTLRGIPEACARLEGMFTGDASQPYKFEIVRTSPNCQARARVVDAAQAKPTVAGGWILNDVIRVPSATCPQQRAVVRVWRHPADATPPKLDAQGRSRIYLQESVEKAKANALAPIPMYTASMALEGKSCGG